MCLPLFQSSRGGEYMREGLMFIANMKQMEPQKSRICRHNLRQVLGRMWVSNLMFWTKTHLLHYSSTRAKYSQERRAEGK